MESDSTGKSRQLQPAQLVVWLLFFLSGACGLIYQVLWCRQLGLIFGNTVQSLAAVLTAFMGGLALGSYLAGKYADRMKRPLLIYGVLELLIGLYCAALPWVFSDASPLIPLYRSLYGEAGGGNLDIARFLISSFLLLIPATCMGATLPALSEYLVRGPASLGKTVGALYAINALGAVVGAVLTGFYFLPEFGKVNTNHIAVVSNIVLGLIAIGLGRNAYLEASTPPASDVTTQEPTNPVVSAQAMRLTVLSFGITGFAAMATQIAWTRAISLGTGSSTYAFSLIVAVFILGLSIGGFWGSRLAIKHADPVRALAHVQLMIGIMGLVIAIILGYGPVIFYISLAMGKAYGWGGMLTAQALTIAAIIIMPTILMGMTMPLTLQAAARSTENPGKTVGRIYAVNTLGSILGSFIGGIVILPVLQLQSTLTVMALLYALPGAVLFFVSKPVYKARERFSFTFGIFLALGLALFQPRWNPNLMSSGLYLLRDAKSVSAISDYQFGVAMVDIDSIRQILFYREGLTCTVAVAKVGDEISLSVGGKPDASSIGDMSTQVGLTMVPLNVIKGKPTDVLIIGLGSGVSAGCALAPTSVERVDVVEMSPEVVESAQFFKEYNFLEFTDGSRPWPKNPKLNMIINDGRNHLLLTSRKYDIIASEPSNPWIAGIGNLFTKEAFTLCRQRLKPGGIMAQWIHSYSLDQEHFLSIVKTFGEVFPNMQLWTVNQFDYLLMGSDGEIQVPLELLKQRLAEPGVHAILKRVQFDTPEELLACFQAPASELKLVSDTAPLHTDDNMLLEFSAPRGLYFARHAFRTARFGAAAERAVSFTGTSPADHADFLKRLDLALVGREDFRASIETPRQMEALMSHASKVSPHQRWAQEFQINVKLEKATRLLKGMPDGPSAVQAGAALELLVPLENQARYAHFDRNTYLRAWAMLPMELERLLKEKKPDEVLALLKKFSNPMFLAREKLFEARAHRLKGNYPEALAAIKSASEAGAPPLECSLWGAQVLFDSGSPQSAVATLDNNLSQAVALTDPDALPCWALRAKILFAMNQYAEAQNSIRLANRSRLFMQAPLDYSALTLDPNLLDFSTPENIRLEATLQEKLGRKNDALFCWHWALIADPGDPKTRENYVRILLENTGNTTPSPAQPVAAVDLARKARRHAQALLIEGSTPSYQSLLKKSLETLSLLDEPNTSFYKGEVERH